MSIAIVTDSTSNISPEMAEELGIHLVYLSIEFSDQSYKDSDLSVDQLFDKIDKQNEIPSSSQPNLGEFIELYTRLAEDYDEILSIHISGHLSGTAQTAHLAGQQAGAKVTVYDSGLVSILTGNLVLKAKEMADAGESMEDIINKLDQMKAGSHLYVVIDTIENIVKGGRLPAIAGSVMGALNIKPVIYFTPNHLQIDRIVRTKKKAIRRMLESSLKHAKTLVGDFKVAMLRVNNKEEVETILKEVVAEAFPGKDIEIQVISPVVSIHSGPGALGIAIMPQ